MQASISWEAGGSICIGRCKLPGGKNNLDNIFWHYGTDQTFLSPSIAFIAVA
jgi:hypothetical protein